MKYLKWGIIGCVIVVLAFAYAHIAKMNLIYDKSVDNSEYLTDVMYEDTVVEQDFVCVEKKLDGVNIKIQVTGEVTGHTLTIEVFDEEENPLAESTLSGEEIKPGKFNRFKFPTLTECKGRKFHVRVTSEGDEEEGLFLIYHQSETMENTAFKIDGETTEGTLILKTITNRFDFETFILSLLIVAFIVAFMNVMYKLFKN